MKKVMLFIASMLVAGSVSAAPMALITSLSDGFEGESSSTVLNYNSFTNWDVTGKVDLKQTPDFGITCLTGSFCVDLDGSSLTAGTLTTKQGFAAGGYNISFSVSGNQRKSAAELNDSLFASFGSSLLNLAGGTITAFEGFTTYYFTDVYVADGTKFSIGTLSNDNNGLILDDVSISAVPVPAALFLFAPALLGFLGLRRKASLAA